MGPGQVSTAGPARFEAHGYGRGGRRQASRASTPDRHAGSCCPSRWAFAVGMTPAAHPDRPDREPTAGVQGQAAWLAKSVVVGYLPATVGTHHREIAWMNVEFAVLVDTRRRPDWPISGRRSPTQSARSASRVKADAASHLLDRPRPSRASRGPRRRPTRDQIAGGEAFPLNSMTPMVPHAPVRRGGIRLHRRSVCTHPRTGPDRA